MGRAVEQLRAEIQSEATTNIFGRKKYPKRYDDTFLYLSARLHDAMDETEHWKDVAMYYRRAFIHHASKYNDLEEIQRVEQSAPPTSPKATNVKEKKDV